MKESESLLRAIDETLENYKVSSIPKIWKIDINCRKKLLDLMLLFSKSAKQELMIKLEEIGFINLSRLSDREKRVIKSRFFEFYTLEDVSKEIGVPKSRIRVIEESGLVKIYGEN